MENLNDLIWTDEDSNENDDARTQDSGMHEVCMIAFCGGMDSAGPSGFACGREWTYKTAACL